MNPRIRLAVDGEPLTTSRWHGAFVARYSPNTPVQRDKTSAPRIQGASPHWRGARRT